jgi:hypothetical protein
MIKKLMVIRLCNPMGAYSTAAITKKYPSHCQNGDWAKALRQINN